MRKRKYPCMTEDQRKIVEKNIPLVTMLVSKYCRTLPAEWDEMMSSGYYALCKAAILYNKDKGCTFSTYAGRSILNQVRRDAHYFKNYTSENNTQYASLNSEVPLSGDDDRTEFIEFLEDKRENVEGEVTNKLLFETIKQYAPIFSELVLRDITLEKLAKERGITKQAIGKKKIEEAKYVNKLFKDKDNWSPYESQNGTTIKI